MEVDVQSPSHGRPQLGAAETRTLATMTGSRREICMIGSSSGGVIERYDSILCLLFFELAMGSVVKAGS